MLLLGREEDKAKRSLIYSHSSPLGWDTYTLFFLKTALSRMGVGPAYYEDPVSSNPTYIKGIKAPLLGWSYEAYQHFIFD